MFRFIVLGMCIMMAACSVSIEETYIDGNDDKVTEQSTEKNDANVKAKANIPVKAI